MKIDSFSIGYRLILEGELFLEVEKELRRLLDLAVVSIDRDFYFFFSIFYRFKVGKFSNYVTFSLLSEPAKSIIFNKL